MGSEKINQKIKQLVMKNKLTLDFLSLQKNTYSFTIMSVSNLIQN